ncbi:MAG: PorP/SprF family type IX secretion system membrane protein [Prevotellaceae bacterium]|jgi:type IX secretion system PorP/SprF family membrane protein|nr:PorP/SprF family type IX secretion system membrane protein [Prevotellaceae bacterium]
MKKNILLLIAVCISGFNYLYSQENPLITQQWYSRINHNPASVGNNDAWDIFMVHRDQWTGFRNAPKTTMLNMHTSIDDFSSGIGLSLAYDRENPARTTIIGKLLYSYRIKVTQSSQLSFGLGVDILNRTHDPDKLTLEVKPDPELAMEKESRTNLGIDFGLEFTTERLAVGVSVTNLGRSYKNLTTFTNGTQYYAYGFYRFPINDALDLSPTGTYVYGNKEHLLEFGATAFFNDNVWGGIVYRIDNAICLMAGFKYNIFRIGYSYDYHTNDAQKFGSTHEVVLSIRIPKPKRGLVRNSDGSYSAYNRIYHCW